MPSPAQTKYLGGLETARSIRAAVSDYRLRPMPRRQSQAFAHAALASLVASWDAYLNELVVNFYTVTACPGDPAFHSLHSIAQSESANICKRFNTPNWENARDLLLRTTGFEPTPCWVWPARHMAGPAVRERLNEILRVRHAFAHGLGIPSYSWNRTPTGRVRLNNSVLRDVESFFNNLVRRTDDGMKSHIASRFGGTSPW
ncbi:MAG: hypothetical protein EA406_05570 [Rhodospirillales bacterium]|nr:MAG: hypothetical protein EA406_05570 [Rhodospirillales bacterium]